MDNFNKKSILITGGGSGLGLSMAQRFSEKGALVTICGRRKEKIDEAVKKLNTNSIGVVADVTNENDRNNIIKQTLEHGKKLMYSLIMPEICIGVILMNLKRVN